MNHRLFIFILLCIILLQYSLQAQTKENPYQLLIIDNLEEYQVEIAKNSDMELVDVRDYLLHAIFDIRYAATNNFTGEKIYTQAEVWARKPVALALQKVEQALDSLGLMLLIFDAYRPYAATIKFYEIYPDTHFVAAPWLGSRHNRGAAVDVSLVDKKTRKELYMPTMFDDFSSSASPKNMNLPNEAIKNRELLMNTMQKYGFTVYPSEWWHYDFQNWKEYKLMNLSFEELNSLK